MNADSECVGVVTIGQVVRAGLSEKVLFKNRYLNAIEEKGFWGKSSPGRKEHHVQRS